MKKLQFKTGGISVVRNNFVPPRDFMKSYNGLKVDYPDGINVIDYQDISHTIVIGETLSVDLKQVKKALMAKNLLPHFTNVFYRNIIYNKADSIPYIDNYFFSVDRIQRIDDGWATLGDKREGPFSISLNLTKLKTIQEVDRDNITIDPVLNFAMNTKWK